MKIDLIERLGLGDRELVAFTGGGGKTTLLLGLSRALADRGERVLVTTTTKLGLDQTDGVKIVWSLDPFQIETALDGSGPVFVLSEGDDHKVRGYEPELVDELFADSSAGFVLVEADGSRGRPVKAPGDHEPVIPAACSLVVVVMGIDAIGSTIFEAAHRPGAAVTLTGRAEHEIITPEVAAVILTHADGGLKGVPDGARVVVALTKVDGATRDAAARIESLVAAHPRIDRVLTVPVDPDLLPQI